ncbi:glutamate-5-semialdehyde dehydrogenase [Candidatus Woesearchaeota archaeon]|nr:glutamate-5-semialdehyde dehydrogenase [Candidatus Woesearchaeota archaeon]|tara:strand:+ start:261 stop:1541 length:1281 start_codon:yes stop_codon:yes gene_type:complete
MVDIIGQVKKAKEASLVLASARAEIKYLALDNIARAIKKNKDKIIEENRKDVLEARKNKLSKSLLDRLILNEKKIKEIVEMVEEVNRLEDPVGKVMEKMELDTNLNLTKITVPIGLIGAIFESRPDAAVQISSLCIKSGNAVILKPGKEAKNTCKLLVGLIKDSLQKSNLPKEAVQLIETREEVKEILKLHDFIDLLIPRGSNKFIKFIQENSKIPVLGHADGICHVYVDKDADIEKAVKICFDAKCQYAAVCNAMETLLVHKDIAEKFLPLIAEKYFKAGVGIKGDEEARKIIKAEKANEVDWKTEYNDLIISIKIVNSVDEAMRHINKYGSKHTDAMVTENKETASAFLSKVDSSSVLHNCSTRFADGFRYGKGAEVGISTSKIHGRGPLGLEGLVIYKYILKGDGHIVDDYCKGKKTFKHNKK